MDIMAEGNSSERVKSFDENIPDSTRRAIEELKSKALEEGKTPCRYLKYEGEWFAYCCSDSPVITDTDRDPNNKGSRIYENQLDLGMLATFCIPDKECYYKKTGLSNLLK